MSLEMSTLRIYSQHLSYIIYHSLSYIYHVVPYIPYIYLITKSLYLLTTSPLLNPPPASDNHRSGFVIYEFVFEA